jgi:hypothetical protein
MFSFIIHPVNLGRFCENSYIYNYDYERALSGTAVWWYAVNVFGKFDTAIPIEAYVITL